MFSTSITDAIHLKTANFDLPVPVPFKEVTDMRRGGTSRYDSNPQGK